MKYAMIVLGLIVVIVAVAVCGFGVWGMGAYNSLVQQDEAVKASWAQVENNYKRRSDVIPNLVETVKGFATHEKSLLESVIKARASATQTTIVPKDAAQMQQYIASQGEISSALSRLMVTVEAYPNLKANENFLGLQSELAGTENRIAVERRNYNEAARAFNAKVRTIPTSLIARIAGMKPYAYFEAEEGAEKAPEVKF